MGKEETEVVKKKGGVRQRRGETGEDNDRDARRGASVGSWCTGAIRST